MRLIIEAMPGRCIVAGRLTEDDPGTNLCTLSGELRYRDGSQRSARLRLLYREGQGKGRAPVRGVLPFPLRRGKGRGTHFFGTDRCAVHDSSNAERRDSRFLSSAEWACFADCPGKKDKRPLSDGGGRLRDGANGPEWRIHDQTNKEKTVKEKNR